MRRFRLRLIRRPNFIHRELPIQILAPAEDNDIEALTSILATASVGTMIGIADVSPRIYSRRNIGLIYV